MIPKEIPITRRRLLQSGLAASALSVLPSMPTVRGEETIQKPAADFEIWDAHGHMSSVPGTPENALI